MHMDVVTKMCQTYLLQNINSMSDFSMIVDRRFKPCASTNENTFMRDQILGERSKRSSGTQKWEKVLLQRVRRTVSLDPHHPFPKSALREHPRPASSLVGERKGEVIIHLPQLLGAIVDRPPSVALHPEHRGNSMARLLGELRKKREGGSQQLMCSSQQLDPGSLHWAWLCLLFLAPSTH